MNGIVKKWRMQVREPVLDPTTFQAQNFQATFEKLLLLAVTPVWPW